MELDERKRKILQAIVENYVEGAEPVSSNNLTKLLGCSSATIRNEMAELERKGLLEKTHTSSGRIPSQKGYRYYVDELIRDDDLTKKEMNFIRDKLKQKVNDLEELTKITTTTLSEITHYTTIAIGPKVNEHIIADIKFVLLGSRVLMALILTDSGIIRESIIKFDEDINSSQIDDLTMLFKNKLVGKSLNEIKVPIEEFITEELKAGINIIKKIIEEINKLLEETANIYLEGTNNITDLPEFKKTDVTKDYLDLLNSKDLVSEILNYGIKENLGDINVYIGNEFGKEELKNFSIVTFKNLLKDKDIGTVGIIGPVRMDYSKVISVMKYISKKINDDYKNGKI